MSKSKMIPKFKVISFGNGGTNMINRIIETTDNKDIGYISISTSRAELGYSNANSKLLIGEKVAKGLGCFADVSIAEKAINESKKEIMEFLQKELKDINIVFIVVGLGGGCGMGATPLITNMIRKMGIVTISVVTTPFSFEGKKRAEQAKKGKEKISKNVDLLINLNNDDVLYRKGVKRSIVQAFKDVDDSVRQSVQEMINTLLSYNLEDLNYDYLKEFIQEKLYNQ